MRISIACQTRALSSNRRLGQLNLHINVADKEKESARQVPNVYTASFCFVCFVSLFKRKQKEDRGPIIRQRTQCILEGYLYTVESNNKEEGIVKAEVNKRRRHKGKRIKAPFRDSATC